MHVNESECNNGRMEGYLAGLLSAEERLEVEIHLDNCERCRIAIEQMAASPSFWSAAANYLDTRRDSEFLAYARPASGSGRFASWSAATDDQSDDNTCVEEDAEYSSFLKDWLAPLDEEVVSTNHNAPLLGRLGKYDVLGVISRGGMGLVLKAFDRDLDRLVAIKTLLSHLASSREAKQRFAREAQTVASMHHRHVIAIYSVDSWREIPYIVMPYLEGGTLHHYASKHQLQLVEILSVAKQIANGLAAAHGRGLVHRDVKPSNVLLQKGLSEVVLSDFGLARDLHDQSKTQSMMLAGTPQFMSPEQVLGNAIDTRSDLFSFGSLLYWLCAGQSPFASPSSYGSLNMIAQKKHRPVRQFNPEIPSWLEQLIDRLLEKDPQNRIQSADELDQLLAGCIEHVHEPRKNPVPQELRGTSASATYKSKITGPWLIPILAACSVVMIMLWTGFGLYSNENKPSNSTESMLSTAKEPIETDLVESEPPYANRRGPLDELDLASMLADFELGKNQLYWLRRLAALPVGELPTSALPWVIKLSVASDEQLQLLANIILDKDPFEIVENRE
jgi:eukaryotic-like serine/threonine-protein kinase